jgi:ADP-ribose pyrophosphatase
MNQDIFPSEVVWSTKWFEIVAKRPPSFAEPHYSIRTKDYVSVIAVDPHGHLLLVRQLRPAVGRRTLEIPTGHVEAGETPVESARKELLEETGYVADAMELLGTLSPDNGRYENRMWCFFASNARPSPDPCHEAEPGIEFVLYSGTVRALLQEKDFDSALNYSAVFLAVLKGQLHI